MATKQYIGARYVPLLADPMQHDSSKSYEALTIVTDKGNSYTSRQPVPSGIPITDETYWAPTGNYNAQIEAYRAETAKKLGSVTHDNSLRGAGTSATPLKVNLLNNDVMPDAGNTVYPVVFRSATSETTIKGIGFHAGDGLTAYNSTDPTIGPGIKLSDDTKDALQTTEASLTSLGAETPQKAKALKGVIDGHTSSIEEIHNDYLTKAEAAATYLTHSNISVFKVSNKAFQYPASTTNPQTIIFDTNDGKTSFNDVDGVIKLSDSHEYASVTQDGIYLVSSEARFGSLTYTTTDKYRGIELLVYINDALMATAPAAVVVGANGSLYGAQYSAFPTRPYKLQAGDQIALRYRVNGALDSAITGTISYCALSVFRTA